MTDEAAPLQKAYRIGIDVGGTFTKAVLIDNRTHALVGRYSVLTTHDHPRGVAAGVIEVFRQVLAQSGVAPADVVFLAHSTTQATNALLEGDVAKVGVLGMAGANAARLAEAQVRVDPIELAPGRILPTANRFLVSDGLSEADMMAAVAALAAEGAEVLVASAAFGVDATDGEEMACRLGQEAGLLTTCGYEITRLYGLATRTRTAVINASILPRMNATASMTEASVREAGIEAPLMIMRGDGGVMDIREMRRRPATTMLSGPAASVAGALMHLRVSDGIYFEVGGTSTNIGVIKGGRPTVTYARVGGHETYVNSLDVRVIGIAGGSLVQAERGQLIDVGPRSAHIAGLPYAAFAQASELRAARLQFYEPKPGDGPYVCVVAPDGRRFALTTTCAANALGYARPGDHAYGDPESARLAYGALGELLGTDAESAARAVLELAAAKVIPVVQTLVREYNLDPDQRLLIGEGGGAAALVPFVAEALGYRFEISRDAEVISSIGVALALVRDVVERIIPHPKPEDLRAIRSEAHDAVVRLGADPAGIDVTIEIDRLTHRVRATAVGAAEMRVKDATGAISESEARSIAARSMGLAGDAIELAAANPGLRVYQERRIEHGKIRAVDFEGMIRIQRSQGRARLTTPRDAAPTITAYWQALAPRPPATPGLLLAHGRHLVDLSGVETLEQALVLAQAEVADLADATPVIIIGLPAAADL
jgi:N-methylhydantoinase A/oxoprolinase/acetone carboxylase beta subunit